MQRRFSWLKPLFLRSDLRWEFANIAAAVALLSVALRGDCSFLFSSQDARPHADLLQPVLHFLCRQGAGFSPVVSFSVRRVAKVLELLGWLVILHNILPGGLYLYQVVGEHLRKFLRWLLTARAGFAVFEIVAAALGVGLATLGVANNIKVLATLVATAIFLVASRARPASRKPLSREIRVFIAGFFVWVLFILHANLVGLQVIRGQNVEVLGCLVFVACLGYVSANRTFANEERLLAINKELEIARRIQSSTLPQSVPTLAGLEIAARYVPMSAVAGDFYDFLSIDEKSVGILVADVTGHGVPAALIASMLKIAFAGQADHAHEPVRVLTGLNRSLCDKFEAHFVTAAYLYVDLEKSLLHYAAAAHPPLLLTSGATGKVSEIEENGLMLGMFPESAYSSVEIRVGPEIAACCTRTAS